MNFLSELLEIRTATQSRIDDLNEEMSTLIDEQIKIAEKLSELLSELEAD